MFTTGLAIFTGVALVLIKLPRKLQLRALRHDVAIDVAVSAVTLAVHWGTFSGVMAATIAGLMTSVFTTAMKRWVGYIDGDQYYPGYLTLKF